MSNMQTIEELRAEIARLKSLSKQQEQQLRQDVKQIREDIRPVNLASNMFTHVTGIKLENNEFFKNGLALGASLLIRKVLLRAETNVEKVLVDFVEKLSSKLKNAFHKSGGDEAK